MLEGFSLGSNPWADTHGYLLSRLRRYVRDQQAANAAEAHSRGREPMNIARHRASW